jgi:hypothetical protein
MAGRPGKLPFYTIVTPVNEKFKDGEGKDASYDLPLVTLPAGTVLFRGVKIPGKYDDVRYFYRDFLGNPERDGTMCMSPIHNVFFYPFPHVAFGTHTIGDTFNMVEAVVLVHPVNVVCAISPSSWVRGQGQRYSGTAPWQRCSNFSGMDIDCHGLSITETRAKEYDNCLNPDYQVRSGTRGWMAIADLDSNNPKKKRFGETKPLPMSESTMGRYLRRLYDVEPEEAVDLVVKAYRDEHLHAGYPEIALYPYKTHQGRRLISRPCSNHYDAIRLIQQEAAADNLNYLPLALITKDGVVDMVNGHFSYHRLGINNPDSYNAFSSRNPIAVATKEWMDGLKSKGLNLPFYGEGKLQFDSRTGFFIFPQILPRNLKIKIPEAILYKNLNAATPSNANKKVFEHELYRNLCMPLTTEEDKRRVHIYEIVFRSFLPEHFMEKYGLEEGYGRRRAFIFERYPFLTPMFDELKIPMPKEFAAPLGRAGALYRKETGKKKKEKPKPVAVNNTAGAGAAAAVAMEMGAPKTPPYGAGTPPFAPVSPAYYPESPVYGANNAEGAGAAPTSPLYGAEDAESAGAAPRSPLYGAASPLYNAEVGNVAAPPPPAGKTPPLPPSKGGRRKTRVKRQSGGKRRTTRRSTSTSFLNAPAMLFSQVWQAHGSVKRRNNS